MLLSKSKGQLEGVVDGAIVKQYGTAEGDVGRVLLSNSKGQLEGVEVGCYCQTVRDSWRRWR